MHASLWKELILRQPILVIALYQLQCLSGAGGKANIFVAVGLLSLKYRRQFMLKAHRCLVLICIGQSQWRIQGGDI
jgi:hypothetical protein